MPLMPLSPFRQWRPISGSRTAAHFIMGLLALLLLTQDVAAQSKFYKLIRAVERRNHAEVEESLRTLSPDTRRQSDGMPLIRLAADNGDSRMLKILIEGGANPNFSDREKKETALMVRARVGNMADVAYLLENGADVNLTDRAQESALIKAVRARKHKIVQYLIDKGASVNRQDLTGKSAMDHAVERRDRRMQAILRQAGG